MKILQVLHSFLPHTSAGTEVYAYKLSKALSKNNEVVIFFRIKDNRIKEYGLTRDKFDGIETFSLNNTFSSCSSFEETYTNGEIDNSFAQFLNKINPDVVHIHSLIFLSHGIVKEIKKKGIPVVFTLHDYGLLCYRGQLMKDGLTVCKEDSILECEACLKYLLRIKKHSMRFYAFLRAQNALSLLKFFKKIYFLVVKKKAENGVGKFKESAKCVCSDIDLFIAPSHFIKNKFIANGIPKDKVIYSPYGFDKSNFSYSRIKKADSETLKFGYMGTLLPLKGLAILISAFKELEYNKSELLVYGKIFHYGGFESYPNALRKLIRGDNRIKLMGGYDNKDAGRIMSGIDVLVVPSIWLENSPLVIQEAFLSGTPVIASRIGGIPELVSDGVNGLLFNPGDANGLKEKMEYIINNPGILTKFRKNMPKVKSIEENAEEIGQIYADLVPIIVSREIT